MISVNLLPRGHTLAFRRARRMRVWIVLCVLEATGLGVAGWVLTPPAGAEQQAWSRFVGASERLRAMQETLTEETARENAASKEAKTAQQLATARVWSPLLAFLAERTPPEVMLTSLRAKVPVDAAAKSRRARGQPSPVPADTPAPVRPDSTLLLTGRAVNHEHLARFMRVLNDSSLFRSVRLGGAERKPFLAGEAVTFSLTCRW